MRIKAFGAACLVAGGMLAVCQPSSGWAQGSTGKITVAGEVGWRGYSKNPDSLAKGKFEEYRDMRAGSNLPGPKPLLEHLLMQYTPADSFGVYTFDVRKLFDRDRSMWLQAKRPGLYDFQVRWDGITHTYTSTARSPGVETNPGFNTLPIPRPDSLAWRNAPYLSAVRQQWDPMKVSLGLTPNDKLDFKAEYTRIGKAGGMPASLTYSGSSGPQREYVAPIDQTMHEFKLSQGFASGERKETSALSFIKTYQVMATYQYSLFNNAIKSVLVDNPQISLASYSTGTNTALFSLAPDNAAQTMTVTGAVMLPARTRVMGTVSTSWMQQNDPFFPQVNNDSLKREPNYSKLALARTSLHGDVKTSVVNFSATSHPVSKLTLAARLRSYKRDDRTPQFHILAMGISDRSVNLGDSLYSEVDPFTKTNTDLSASYQLMSALSLTAGYAMENWTRDSAERNIGKTKDKGPRVSVDYNGVQWLSLHAGYTTTKRRMNDASYVEAGTELLNWRRFDVADRDRKKTSLIATVTPIEQASLTFNYQVNDDKFPNSQYGTTFDKVTSTGFDLDLNPTSRLSVSVGYSKDDGSNSFTNRYRTGRDTVGSPTYNNPTYVWISENTDKNTTTFASISAVLIPNKLDLVASLSNIDGKFVNTNVNPSVPTGGTATQNLSATVDNYPEVTQNVKPVSVSLRYRYSPDWAVTLRYQSEKYTQNDFRTLAPVLTSTGLASGTPLTTNVTGNLPGSIGTVTGSNTGQLHFLGSGYLPYNAEWFTLMITYRPSSLPFSKARSTF